MDIDDLIRRLRGRARFCRDRGEVKSPMLISEAADALGALWERVKVLEGALQVLEGELREHGYDAEGTMRLIIRAALKDADT